MSTSKSVFERNFDPVRLAGLLLIASFVIMLLGKAVSLGGGNTEPRFAWLTAATFLLVFAMFNAIFSVSSKSMVKYWSRSVYSFLGLALISGCLAWLFSGLRISEAGSYRWIFGVITFGYLVFISMMAFMRQIVDFAQKEEWNHPRIRRKK